MEELFAVLEAHCHGATHVTGDSHRQQATGYHQANQPLIRHSAAQSNDNGQLPCRPADSRDQSNDAMQQNHLTKEESSPPNPVQSSEASQSGQTENTSLNSLRSSGHLCAVCNDVASGFHYGVWSCEGCKAFFKRSIQGHVDYVCPATNTCMIDKQRRKSCQACRLRKCNEAGMCKTSIKTRSVNKSKTAVKRKSEDGTGNSAKKLSKETFSSGSAKSFNSQPCVTPTKSIEEDSKAIPQALQLVSKLVEIEPHAPDLAVNFSENTTLEQYLMPAISCVDKELINNINWAKQVPEYCSLTLNDQVHLLECSWFETCFFRFTYRCIPFPGKLYIGPNFIIDIQMVNAMGFKGYGAQMMSFVERLRELKVTKEEYVLLMALTLFNPDKVLGLEEKSKLRQIQEKYMKTLHDYVTYTAPNIPARSAHLLLLLSSLGRIAHEGQILVYNIKSSGLFPVCELLSEMLEAQRNTDTFSDLSLLGKLK
ncbi:estrogen receptor isoform X2 [Lingula anatina]|uniref:Estrogen receptor isoform X2 n=1 Tax=Lingula anatina TaxID=7574 RepID=A0A1S3J2V9_LINAN|nr:estrogen receptor isoform X2 [Lingula anatina]|eukprot:XP_013404578.1 estrogen receptor isoform X2 [Lingula anatina]